MIVQKAVYGLQGFVGTLAGTAGVSAIMAAIPTPSWGEVIAGVGLVAAGVAMVVRVIVRVTSERNAVMSSLDSHTVALAEIKRSIDDGSAANATQWDRMDARIDRIDSRVTTLEALEKRCPTGLQHTDP